jgi:hypothetical protein
MSTTPSRKLRRLAESEHGHLISEAAITAFVKRVFRPKPAWVPRFLWNLILSIVIK